MRERIAHESRRCGQCGLPITVGSPVLIFPYDGDPNANLWRCHPGCDATRRPPIVARSVEYHVAAKLYTCRACGKRIDPGVKYANVSRRRLCRKWRSERYHLECEPDDARP